MSSFQINPIKLMGRVNSAKLRFQSLSEEISCLYSKQEVSIIKFFQMVIAEVYLMNTVHCTHMRMSLLRAGSGH